MSTAAPQMPAFAEFYEAVNGYPPFPWQQRLALLAADAAWPAEIGVPTGLGKTSCLDIAVWALAGQAELPPSERTAPTRIWWLVNRRLLVDTTADHAERLAAMLANPDEADTDAARRAVLAEVARRLRLLSPDGRTPLEVIRLRGGVGERGQGRSNALTARPSTPAQPAVILSTLPMYGSRLLFGGYGVSQSMRPVDAALAGTDSLVLIDEAHLARNLVALFAPLAECDRSTSQILGGQRCRPQPVTLTATGSVPDSDRFDIDDDDRAHPVIARRLSGGKPMTIVAGDAGTSAVPLLAAAAVDALNASPSPTSVVVFANTPATARKVHSTIVKDTGNRIDADVVLLTGRMRQREGQAVRRAVLDPETGAPSSRADTQRTRHLVVVATQTLEVGADLDFEHLVTEACGRRALTQRLGRLNRLGRYAHSTACYVHVPPKAPAGASPSWPVYGDEPSEVLERLLANADGGVVEMGLTAVRDVLGAPCDDAGFAPQVLPALLREWAKTTVPPEGAAPVEQYFAGLREPDLAAEVCWRSHIPESGLQLWPRLQTAETIEMPVYELRAALEGVSVQRLGRDRLTLEDVDAERIRPGDIVVLPSDSGLHDEHGWAPEVARGNVADMAVPSQGVPLDPEALRRLAGPGPWKSLVAAILSPPDDAEPDEISAAVGELVAALAAAEPVAHDPGEWSQTVARLDSVVQSPPLSVPFIAALSAPDESRSDDLDEMSLAAVVGLALHGDGVGRYAQRIAERLGMAGIAARSVGIAAELHDIGKIDQRFQRWLDPLAASAEPVAKSGRRRSSWQGDRIASGWPAGGRHEALSGRLVAAALAEADDLDIDIDLVVHLVVSHHGHGRPLLLAVADGSRSQVTATVAGRPVSVPADLGEYDWGQPARFRALCERYGFWGLALLEASVRQADHMVTAGSVDWAVI